MNTTNKGRNTAAHLRQQKRSDEIEEQRMLRRLHPDHNAERSHGIPKIHKDTASIVGRGGRKKR